MNYSAFVRAFVAVNLVFCAVACLWIPVWSGRGKSVFAASLICFLPWLLIAFRMSAGQVRAFFGVSFFVVLLMIPLTDVADHQHFRAIVAAGLLGGLVMLRAAWMRKLGPAETLVDAPISACEEGLIWDGKAFLLALLASVMAVIIVAQLQFSGRPGEIFADLSGDFVLLSVMIMVMTAVFMAMRAWKPRVSAAQLFLSIGALQLFLVWPLLSNPLEGQLPPVVQVSAYAAGLAAGFALIKFGKIRKKQ